MAAPRHPFDGIRIPRTFQNLLASFRPYETWQSPFELAWERAPWLFELDTDTLRSCLEFEDERVEDDATPELRYASTPFELVPVSWNGGDGLHYDWVVHAPELDADEFPMVSYAPVDDGAVWLGDDTAEGLANLLVGRRRGWQRWEKGRPDPALDPRWAAIVTAIGRTPDLDDPRITVGARSDRPCIPRIPDGYRFEPGPDGIGVLAPADRFGDLHDGAPDSPTSSWCWGRSEALIREDAHAGALVWLKRFRQREPEDRETVERMLLCYEALDRPMHARRAERWLSFR